MSGHPPAADPDTGPSVLVAYATTHGHTGRIARRVAGVLRERGLRATLEEIPSAGSDVKPVDYDAVIVAASLHAGRHQHQIEKWARVHATTLDMRPNAMLSVSLAAADDTSEAREATRACTDRFVEETGWTPRRTLHVAGAFQFDKYDLPTRIVMRLVARRHDEPADLVPEIEYTDWAAVERFAREFAASVRAGSG